MTGTKGKRRIMQKHRPETKKAVERKYKIDCKQPVEDGILNVPDFEAYLRSKVRINNKLNNFGPNASLTSNKTEIVLTTDQDFSKRYYKFLVKRYLRKNNLRDYLRVLASDKYCYVLKYFQITNDDDDEAGDD